VADEHVNVTGKAFMSLELTLIVTTDAGVPNVSGNGVDSSECKMKVCVVITRPSRMLLKPHLHYANDIQYTWQSPTNISTR
jgi:hypothetical protein